MCHKALCYGLKEEGTSTGSQHQSEMPQELIISFSSSRTWQQGQGGKEGETGQDWAGPQHRLPLDILPILGLETLNGATAQIGV